VTATSITRESVERRHFTWVVSGNQCFVARYSSTLALDATFANAGTLA